MEAFFPEELKIKPKQWLITAYCIYLETKSLHAQNTFLKYTPLARATFLPALQLVLYWISPTTASTWRGTTRSLRPAASSQTFRAAFPHLAAVFQSHGHYHSL